MPLDLQNDYKVFDGLEDITIEGEAITGAYREDIFDLEAAPSEGVYLHRNVAWQLPTDQFPTPIGGIIPRIGQAIVAAGVTYTVLDVRHPFLNDYYGVATRRAQIESDLALSDKITRYPAISWLDEECSRIVSNAAADPGFTDVPGKVQDVSADHAEFMGKRGFTHLYHIYVDREIDLSHSDVLKDAHMNVYDVVSWTNRDRIDELSMIVAGTTGN